jgi:alpha-tubulin suppressor-like RCC1 family protein
MLTKDLDGLQWHSKNKAAAKSCVRFQSVKEIVFSQRTEKFRLGKRKDLDHRSFSLIYHDQNGEDTLDLVCKDEEEFQLWTSTLDALVARRIPASVLDRVKTKLSEGGTIERSSSGGKMVEKGKSMASFQGAFQGANDIFSFGWGEWGQNGYGTPTNANTPALLESLLGKGALQIGCGWAHTVVLMEDGEVKMYGCKLGTGLVKHVAVPTTSLMEQKVAIVSVHCGAYHTLALTENGALLGFGNNIQGQLGLGDNVDRMQPTPIPGLRDVEAVAAGVGHSVALTVKGDIFVWGDNSRGQLGLGAQTAATNTPTVLEELSDLDMLRVACGDFHTVTASKSEVLSWGWNSCGQLGLGDMEDRDKPTVVEMLKNHQVTSLDCGAAHTVAAVYIPKFNTYFVYGWGSNLNGQLGHGKKRFLLKPNVVPDLNKDIVIDEVACGTTHTILRTDEGEILSAGGNRFGQLGHSNVSDMHTFKSVKALAGRVSRQVACGGEHTCILTARTWVEDKDAKECMNCKVVFTFVVRKHHCRNCGGIFCSKCSDKRIAILKYGLTDPVRVCTSCYSKLGGR